MVRIVDGTYLMPLGMANAVLLDSGHDLALVDAGFPNKESFLFDAIRQLGRTPRDLRHLIFTHGHPDHIGSAAAIVGETGATTYMHALDNARSARFGSTRPCSDMADQFIRARRNASAPNGDAERGTMAPCYRG